VAGLIGHVVDAIEIDAVLRAEDAPGPNASGLRVRTHADLAAVEIHAIDLRLG
jgi:hypothetical protein